MTGVAGYRDLYGSIRMQFCPWTMNMGRVVWVWICVLQDILLFLSPYPLESSPQTDSRIHMTSIVFTSGEKVRSTRSRRARILRALVNLGILINSHSRRRIRHLVNPILPIEKANRNLFSFGNKFPKPLAEKIMDPAGGRLTCTLEIADWNHNYSSPFWMRIKPISFSPASTPIA